MLLITPCQDAIIAAADAMMPRYASSMALDYAAAERARYFLLIAGLQRAAATSAAALIRHLRQRAL